MTVVEEMMAQLKDMQRRLLALEAEDRFMLVARLRRVAAQTLVNNTYDIVDFDTEDYDNYSACTTGAGAKFTCPIPGYYFITSGILIDDTDTWADGERAKLIIGLNGGIYSEVDSRDLGAAVAIYKKVTGSDTIYLDQTTDYVQIAVYQNSGGNLSVLADAYSNYVSIFKI